MKLIKDIRIYKSKIENIDGNSLPSEFAKKSLNVILHRIVMKLRENKFSLGDFDHLYLNYTTCLPDGSIEPAKRSVDYYHPWYRYYDIGIGVNMYDSLDENSEFVIDNLQRTLVKYFSDAVTPTEITEYITTVVQEGQNMKVLYKEKKAAENSAVVYLRYLDSGMYWPLLYVYNLAGQEIFRTDLPKMIDLYSLGEIQLSSKKITIKPRKNIFSKKRKPITYEF